ncbi:ARM repeat-containing protein [Exidia glandulosa HHB12029]|uniref:ARM repeat-containing protein n=1 Tax=Exidia glandulosa HHB12029 TaxID=1314781 RepID=A0A165N7B8_EXIGL|nr:ARM repeat-containing protein [Exidia glandulosa HHB12029]
MKRHTALKTRLRTFGPDNVEAVLKEINGLSLEKYITELTDGFIEGLQKCKNEKDIWSALQVCRNSREAPALTALHRSYALLPAIQELLVPPPRTKDTAANAQTREKDDNERVTRQKAALRLCAELAMVRVIQDGPGRSGGEWVMKTLKGLLSNDPTLTSLPILVMFIKVFGRPYLGLTPAAAKAGRTAAEAGTLSDAVSREPVEGRLAQITDEGEELVEKDIRERFRRMCEGYFEKVGQKLVIEHNRLREQDRRNHEAYIRSGEIFEDRQKAYEKMTQAYEKILTGCQTLSELLYLPMPDLPTEDARTESIGLSTSNGQGGNADDDGVQYATSKWEAEEERKFYEDIQDLKDFVPKSFLGLNDKGELEASVDAKDEPEPTVVDETARGATPPPRTPSPTDAAALVAPQGPSQMLTALLANLSDATNRTLIDQIAVDFAMLNSKAARKRLIKFLTGVPKSRTDLLPHYGRLVATLNPYMPDVGKELVANLEEEFRYLQRKKNIVELNETRIRNTTYFAVLTKFKIVPAHVILHIFKVFLDDFSTSNIECATMLLEGCGRFLLRSDDTKERMTQMFEAMKRKQSMQHMDTRYQVLLENAFYQCNPPERSPREEKQRSPMEMFLRHVMFDMLSRRTIDKVLRLMRRLPWDDPEVRAPQVLRLVRAIFVKPWKIKYGNISLMAMLVYDLQRYYPAFTVDIVDQVLEDVRFGMEQNLYKRNQRRVATIKYFGELYIYRLISSNLVFDTMWSLVTFGHPEGRPLPGQFCPLDMPDDFFRIRLICSLLDTVGMCFDRGTHKRKLDNFITFFQMYMFCKNKLPMDVEFMVIDTLEALRPKLVLFKSFEEAASAVDEMFNGVLGNAVQVEDVDGDSDGGEDAGSGRDDGSEPDGEEDEEDDGIEDYQSKHDSAPGSPEADERIVQLHPLQEEGPSQEQDDDFAKELAKLISDTTEARKVDRKTAMAMWDSNVLPTGVRRKRNAGEEHDEDDEGHDEGNEGGQDVMKFTLLSRKGNKQQMKQLPIPAQSLLAVNVRSAQAQDKEEQQHLKKLVLDYEHREEIEELKAMEATARQKPIRIRLAG